MRFELDVSGDRLISRDLLGVELRALDARPAFREIAGDLIDFEKALFRSEGSSGGDPWKPLQPATVAAKLRKGQDPRILRATGALRRSLTVRSDPAMLLDIDRDGLTFGSRLDRAIYHQQGTRNMPARKPLQLTELQKRHIVRVLQRHLVAGRANPRRAA